MALRKALPQLVIGVTDITIAPHTHAVRRCAPLPWNLFSQQPQLFLLRSFSRLSVQMQCAMPLQQQQQQREKEKMLMFPNPWSVKSRGLYNILTDNRLPKRRPCLKKHKKRRVLRVIRPHSWIPGRVNVYPAAAAQNESEAGAKSGVTQSSDAKSSEKSGKKRARTNKVRVRRSNHQHRMRMREKFKVSEARKRRSELYAARHKKAMKRIERQKAAVERERAWAVRLAILQQAEPEAKNVKA